MTTAINSVAGAGVNPDLAKERKKCTFRVAELTNLLDGDSSATTSRHEIEQRFVDNPKIARYVDYVYLSSDDYYSKGVEASVRMYRTLKDMDLLTQTPSNQQYASSAHILNIAVPSGDPLIVHKFMFIPALIGQGTKEQQAKWQPLATKNIILGAFCQTELGHGTNMKGLETTATYDPKTEEFILNSPTVTSMKFWAGGLGRTANSAIVVAQLHTQGVCHGLHSFFVQLRSYKDHTPLPGITLGELGPKMGLNANDNGFLKLVNVRIPRTNMLMKHTQVLQDGAYVKSSKPQASYGTLVVGRTIMIMQSSLYLAQAATIAVRYNAIRRQGGSCNSGEPETKILDYQTQQYKIFPQVAMAYAGLFVTKVSFKLMFEFLANPTPEVGAEIHSLCSGVKAQCCQTSSHGIEVCLLSCGGLGHLQASRFPFLYGAITAGCTFDGDNTVLLLQTAKFLMRSYQTAKDGKQLSSSVAYLAANRQHMNRSFVHDRLEEIQYLFQNTTASLISQVAKQINDEKANSNGSVADEELTNSQTAEMVKCAQLHIQGFMLCAATTVMGDVDVMSDSLKGVLRRLFEFLGLYWIREGAGDFMQYGGVSISDMANLNSRFFVLLDELRPDIVGLVDAFDFRDESLQSVIGCYDGQVYDHVHDYLMKLPSNQQKVHPAFEKFLRPLSQSKL